MAKDTKAEQPPYFNIDPDKALAALGKPLGTDGFASIAKACAAGRDDLSSRGMNEDGRKQLRHQISDPHRAGPFPTRAETEPRPAPRPV